MQNNNIGYLCSTVHCKRGGSDKLAVQLIDADLNDGQRLTFGQLDEQSNQYANMFSRLGLAKGDQVFFYLPKVLEYYPLVLGALKKELIVSPLFSNFGPKAILERLEGESRKIIITKKSLYSRVEKVLAKLKGLIAVLLIDLPDHPGEIAFSLNKLRDQVSSVNDQTITRSETPSLLHFTSGSTGKPKGVIHIHKAANSILSSFQAVFQPQSDDVFWCSADPGWVTGMSYGFLAPLLNGTTLLQYEGPFDPDTWFQIIEKYRVNLFYTAPTVLRMMMQDEQFRGKNYDLSALRAIFSVGEPLNPEIYRWGLETFNKQIFDTWFQTETGSIMICNRPGLEIQAGSMGKPLPYISPEILDEKFEPIEVNTVGKLALKPDFDSLFVNYLGQEEEYRSKFKNGFYITGDLARKDENGYFWFIGRDDDVINTSGHLVSPFEVESCIIEIPEIVDVGVIAAPDPLLWQKVVAFVTLAKGQSLSKSLELKVKLAVSNQVSSVAIPSEIVVTDQIPKNRSGKILRRVLRARYAGVDFDDNGVLED